MRPPFFLKFIAFCTALIFGWNQIVFAEGVNPYEIPPAASAQPATEVSSLPPVSSEVQARPLPTSTIDFLVGQNSPLSTPDVQTAPSAFTKTNNEIEKPRKEISQNGTAILHVYEGESIQGVIDQAAAGDTVFVHAGTYHAHLVLKDSVSLQGEDAITTIIHGDFQAQTDVIRALGNNRIENLTVTGGGPYRGVPASAMRVEGDNVKIRGNRFLDNRDYGVYVFSGADTLIEMNLFKDTHIGVQLPKDTTVIRYNTFIRNDIAVNSLYGARPRIENNIFADSSFQSIYEFDWSSYSKGQLSRGFALVKSNTFFNNKEEGSAYGSATPVAVEAQTLGNQYANPDFVGAAHGNYAVSPASSSFGRGAFLPAALASALNRASTVNVKNTVRNITAGQSVIGYQIVYDEGSVEEFYNDGRQVLDTIPPVIVILSETIPTSQAAFQLVYTVDGGIPKTELRTLAEGANTLIVTASDIFGNQSSSQLSICLDQTPPAGSASINNGAVYTTSQNITIDLSEVSDGYSGLDKMHFSADGGMTWTNFEDFSEIKSLKLPVGEGMKEVRAEVADKAGNKSIFTCSIQLVSEVTVEFTSVPVVTNSDYLLTYRVNGENRSEYWQLSPGVNPLLVRIPGEPSVSARFDVTLDQSDIAVPDMPSVPALPAGLISVTAQNGLVMKYSGDSLVAIENPGGYVLYDPQTDQNKNLTAGHLVFSDNAQLLYKDGRPVYSLSVEGAKTVYNTDGTVAYMILADGAKTRFAYHVDGTGKVISVLSMEQDVTGLYDEQSKPVWIGKVDGTEIWYEKGFLERYVDASENIFDFRVMTQKNGETVTGYRSKLLTVKPQSSPDEIPAATFLSDSASYPTAKTTFENQLALSFDYDASGKIIKTVSGKQEVLELADGIPVSFKNAAGQLFNIESEIAENGDLLSVSFAKGAFEQIYDNAGQLSGLRLTDGTFLNVTDNRLDQVILEDGGVLTQMTWDGQSLTGFRREFTDGAVEIYQNKMITERVAADGTRTVFINYSGKQEAENVYTEDGKTYKVVRYDVSPGITERLTQLESIDMPDGGRIEFKNGRPVRYIQTKNVQVEPYEVPGLVSGRFFVPVIDLPKGKLRSLTVDQSGYIYSGEILFNDGTQYLIENNLIVKQISTDGRFIEFNQQITPVTPEPAVAPEPLTQAEEQYRTALIETQLDYFENGKGIHAGTGLPMDNYKSAGAAQSDYSQATLVGFWAEILVAIARGDYQTSKMTRAQAFEKLEVLLTTFREVQRQVGWNGMVAFFKIVEKQEPVLDDLGQPTGQTRTVYGYKNAFDQYGFGDAVNLAVSLSSVIGALQGTAVDPGMETHRDQILSLADEILTVQEPGYAAFYDAANKRFHGAYAKNSQTGQWAFVDKYFMDRIFNEFRPGMALVAARYPQYTDAFTNLDITLRRYQTSDEQSIELAVPYDGGAFQMFWPLIHVDETQYSDFNTALRNFLYAQAESANENGIPGLPSAGDRPGYGYEGKIGDFEAAEADDLKYNNIGSIYGTASAFALAPHYALQFLKNLETAFPQIRTDAGFVDAITYETVEETDPGTGETRTVTRPVFSSQYYGVDQASFVLSLLKTSQDYFSDYLATEGIKNSFDNLYKSVNLNLMSIDAGYPPAPGLGGTPGLLYTGSNPMPDGESAGFVKQAAFVSTVLDPELGEGHVFNYLRADGSFHHSEIEFGEDANVTKMTLQEYLMSSGRGELGRSLFGKFEFDLYNSADRQGPFFDNTHPDRGYASVALTSDPSIGEVRRLAFDFKESQYSVGMWNLYETLAAPKLDISGYDFLSIPVRIGDNTPENIRLKFEFKGSGNIFITDSLKRGWQYVTIPIIKPPDGLIYEIATTVQPADGSPVKGEVYLGPLSAFKVRTDNVMDWSLVGKTAGEIRTLIQKNIATQAFGGGQTRAAEVLEDFTIDSNGKLLQGTLKRADGGIQYFDGGQLVKWVFKNGRTVLYEKGIASFIVDLSRGKLETARFYYDEDLKGTVRSFNVQDNNSKRVFGSDGKLQELVREGYSVDYRDGEIDSITTSQATLTNTEFGTDGSLLRAHVVLSDGRFMEVDEQYGSAMDMGGGTKIFYRGKTIIAVETAQNGRTDFTYHYDAAQRIIGVDATFAENGQPRTMSLFEYLQRPERGSEKAQIVSNSLDVIAIPDIVVWEYSFPRYGSGETATARKGSFGYDSRAYFTFRYQNTSANSEIGMTFKHFTAPFQISDYGFLSLTLMEDPAMTWGQDFNLSIKGPSYNPLYSFEMNNVQSGYQTFWFPMAGKSGQEGEITLALAKEQAGIGKTGTVYIKDLSYMSVRTLDNPLWQTAAGITLAQLQNLKSESDNLSEVGAEIAQKKALYFTELTPYLDAPTRFTHRDTTAEQNELLNFCRFDGTEVELDDSEVTRMILSDGTVNEYEPSGGTSQTAVKTTIGDSGVANYNYGTLRRITQTDGRQYDLSYEFCGSTAPASLCGEGETGTEITVFKDVKSGEERRFKNGKLQTSTDSGGLTTNYTYADGEMIGAELTYRNRVLNSTRYAYDGSETQVTDERGTIWFYDKDGKLIKHMTRDGFLYEYSGYTQSPTAGVMLDPEDYKNALYSATDLKAVTLKGYQASDGSWILFDGTAGSEVHLISGTQAVNITLDEDQRIKSGQIQFADGMILVIENYAPVSGRSASGAAFTYAFPAASDYELLQGTDGSYLGFRFKLNGRVFTYNQAGELTKAETEDGVKDTFIYTKDAQGKVTGYTDTERRQVSFNGIPFPKECDLTIAEDQKLFDSGVEIAAHSGNGFLVGVFKEAENRWEVFAGTFASGADKLGLKNFLTGVKPGEYVAASVSDTSFASIGEELLGLLEGFGAGQIRAASVANQKWGFFGNERLAKGQSLEKSGAASFSTVTTTSVTYPVASGTQPVFQTALMTIGVAPAVYQAYDNFLKACQPLRVARDMQRLTVYDSKSEILYTRRLDGMSSFYEGGKVRETFANTGELLTVHEYQCPAGGCLAGDDMTISKITLVKARQDFTEEILRAAEQIEQAKFDALYKLAWQDEVARLQIKENVDIGVAQVDSQIASFQSQKYQTVKQCSGWWIFKSCKEYTYEVPGVQGAINDLAVQRTGLILKGEEQLTEIPGAVAEKKTEIEQATAEKKTELDAQAEAFLLDILREEMTPVATDLYRIILGRDPSTDEISQWVTRFRSTERINVQTLRTELQNSSERAASEAQKTAIIQGVRSFLEIYLAPSTSAEIRAQMLQGLDLNVSETVALTADDVTKVLAWLESRDLHFGQSAFLSLKKLLVSRGIDVPVSDLGKDTILIDVLTGVINKFSEGDLLISMFAMDRAATVRGRDLAAVKYTYADLLSTYQSVCGLQSVDCSLRMIAHIGEDHFVLLKRVTDTEVVYEETNKGVSGEEVTVTKDVFLKLWLAGDAGHLLVSEDQAVSSKKISDAAAMKIRGAFFPIFFVIAAVLSFASMAASFFSPTLGKILGYVALGFAIAGIVAAVGQIVVQGLQMAFTQIAQQGFLATVKQGIAYVGKVLVEGVRYVGRFIQNGFAFLKDCFTGGLNMYGAGITNLGGFLKDGINLGQFTSSQVVVRQLVAAGVAMSITNGLGGLGVSPVIASLAGAFAGGGCLGLGGTATSFIKSGLQQMALLGVSEMATHIGLSPPVTDAIFLVAGAGIKSFFNPDLTLKVALASVAPTIAQQLSMGGIELLGRSMGLDPRITALIGMPMSAAVGGITKDLLSPSDSVTSIWKTITGAFVQEAVKVGLSFSGATDSLFGSLLSSAILSSVETAISRDGLFTGVFNILKRAVLMPFNLVNGIVQQTVSGLKYFSDLITEKGFFGALESVAGSIFSRQTLEKILKAGGMEGLLGSSAKTPGTLPNGQNGLIQSLGGGTYLYYDTAGNFVGKTEDGITQIGIFGTDQSGKWGLFDGKVTATMEDGSLFTADVHNGQMYKGTLGDSSGATVGIFNPEGGQGPIVIDGRESKNPDSSSSGSFWSGIFDLAVPGLRFFFENGSLKGAEAKISGSGGANGQSSAEPFFVMANGIMNSVYDVPSYYHNFQQDLANYSQQDTVTIDDALAIPLYPPSSYNPLENGILDILQLTLESANKYPWVLRWQVDAMLSASSRAKTSPIIGIGYSGGFIPLAEGLIGGPMGVSYDVRTLVGLGAATMSLTKDMIDIVLALIGYLNGKITAARSVVYDWLAKLSIFGDNALRFVEKTEDGISKFIDWAVDTLRTALKPLQKVLPSNLPALPKSAEMLVNVYGTEDILNQTGIGGYRSELYGFNTLGVVDSNGKITNKLYNIEILGADHFNYLRDSSQPDQVWNPDVSSFVTALTLASSTNDALQQFISQNAAIIFFNTVRNVYEVRLPGYERKMHP